MRIKNIAKHNSVSESSRKSLPTTIFFQQILELSIEISSPLRCDGGKAFLRIVDDVRDLRVFRGEESKNLCSQMKGIKRISRNLSPLIQW